MIRNGVVDLANQQTFVTIPDRVIYSRDITATEKILLAVMSLNKVPMSMGGTRGKYVCNLTQKVLMELAGINSSRTITTAINNLENFGAIKIIPITDSRGRKLGNVYQLADYDNGFKPIEELTEEELELCIHSRR